MESIENSSLSSSVPLSSSSSSSSSSLQLVSLQLVSLQLVSLMMGRVQEQASKSQQQTLPLISVLIFTCLNATNFLSTKYFQRSPSRLILKGNSVVGGSNQSGWCVCKRFAGCLLFSVQLLK